MQDVLNQPPYGLSLTCDVPGLQCICVCDMADMLNNCSFQHIICSLCACCLRDERVKKIFNMSA